jgi:hypothetical protein
MEGERSFPSAIGLRRGRSEVGGEFHVAKFLMARQTGVVNCTIVEPGVSELTA